MNDREWFSLHNAYLATPEWRIRREAVLLRDWQRGGCQARLRCCTAVAEEVHHLTYQHWRNEPLYDLIAVCHRCHEELTRMDRNNRAPDGRLTRGERGLKVEHERLREEERARSVS